MYGAGRRRLVDTLNLHQGQQVLDIGCGTGLNFPLLQQRVSASGIIVGIDRSNQMLKQARNKALRRGWSNVILIQADATTAAASDVAAEVIHAGGRPLSDVGLATYALSLMENWGQAFRLMWQLTDPQAQLGIVDMQRPTGLSSLWSPLAAAACWLGGADIEAHPWTVLERDCAQLRSASSRGGHLQIRAGVKPPAGGRGGR